MEILVADDSKTNLAIIKSALEKLGHQVSTADSAKDAIKLFSSKRPDLIILDVVMEGMNGFECAKEIRKLSIDDWIPIIFLSASVDDESIAKGIDAGGDDYLTKPFSDITLAAKIKAMQRIADMRQKLFETSQKLYQLSSTDPLTGIYNRLQFDRSIREIFLAAQRYHYLIALLFIDLDNFKSINDTFGHHIGDLLLIEVAKRIKTCLRANDFLARLGGDEFAVVLGEIKSTSEAKQIAQKIIDKLSFDYNLENHHIRNCASIGIACYEYSGTHESLMLNADIAMYHAKASGRNNYQFFTDDLHDKYKKLISLEHALKFALERNELFLTYQPIFDLQNKRILGIEALINWDHPTLGLISPSVFIPLAEEIGLINHIGNWVLQSACAQAMAWSINRFSDFKLAINIASRQLLHESFCKEIGDILDDTKFPPNQLELELTETVIMSNATGPFKEVINKLHDLNIGIAIDDFGTGYSSLFRLKHLPITTLKIDKTFINDVVSNENSAIIVNCLIALGKNLGLNVIAEGIETKEQLGFLIQKKCPQGQGFLLCRPLDLKQMTKFIEKMNLEKIK